MSLKFTLNLDGRDKNLLLSKNSISLDQDERKPVDNCNCFIILFLTYIYTYTVHSFVMFVSS